MLDKKINKAQERPLYESQIKPYAFHPVYFIANAYLGFKDFFLYPSIKNGKTSLSNHLFFTRKPEEKETT